MKIKDPKIFFDISKEVSETYGFNSVCNISPLKKGEGTPSTIKKSASVCPPQQIGLQQIIKLYVSNRFHENDQALFTFHSNIDTYTRNKISRAKKPQPASFSLSIVGLNDALAEAILLSCARKILQETGIDNPIIRINSTGDKQSAERYGQAFRKTLLQKKKILPENLFKVFREDPVKAHVILHTAEECREVRPSFPINLKFLSEHSRSHFQSVLEYLDQQQASYELAFDLIDNPSYQSHTLFEITDGENIHAKGGRFNTLSNLLFKKDIPSAQVTIYMPDQEVKGSYVPVEKRKKKAKVFLIHAGYFSRLHALPLLHTLRENRVPIAHRFDLMKVSEQLEEGGALNYPYHLIVGHQEAQDKIVRVRNVRTKEQVLIPFDKIPVYLKRLR